MNLIDGARLQYDDRAAAMSAKAERLAGSGGPVAGEKAAGGKVSVSGARVTGAAANESRDGSVARIDKGSKLYQQCQEFESLFVKQMLNEMKKSVEKSGFVDGGPGEEIFSDMLYDEYAKAMSRNAGLGLADQMYLQLATPEKASKAYS